LSSSRFRWITLGGVEVAEVANQAKEAEEIVQRTSHAVVEIESSLDQLPVRPLSVLNPSSGPTYDDAEAEHDQGRQGGYRQFRDLK
jgi:hypothetical protein